MCYLTYGLKVQGERSSSYYNKIKCAKDEIMNNLFTSCKEYIEDFLSYIKIYITKNIRTNEEYFIELLLIGVLKLEYEQYIDNVNRLDVLKCDFLNKLRRYDLCKVKVDKLRGKMNSRIFLSKEEKHIYNDLNIKKMIRWLKCSGDFEEESIRLENWRCYLEDKDEIFIKIFSKFISEITMKFEFICEKYLDIFVENVEKYLREYRVQHENREDIIYCGKGKIQYYFNMVCSEIMNDVYRSRFLGTKNKLVFLPACMRQQEKRCMSIKSERGYKCMGCSPLCNVNKLRKQGEAYGFEVTVIPHETDLLALKKSDNSSYGIVGIACVLNLVSGGFKALRLGFIPQCVVLNEVGCSNHWFLRKGRMTEINEDRLLSRFQK